MYDSGGGGFSITREGERLFLIVEKMEDRDNQKCQGQLEREGRKRDSDGQRRRIEEEEMIRKLGPREKRSENPGG